jgi:bacillithiol biosynthesis cysteine-adding enzyme BshC
MKSTEVPFSETGFFSNLVLDYLAAKPRLDSFYKYPVSLDSFSKIIADKKSQKIDRKTLVDVLRDQYKDVPATAAVKANIDALLNENTFTVTAAHQPDLFLGPLYFLYKTASAINLVKQIQLENPDYTIVPVFFLGSEDHDVAELAHVTVLGNKFEWNPNQGGAFGRMKTTGLDSIINEISGLFGSNYPDSGHIITLVKKFYDGYNTIATATRLLMDSLFGKYGLVVLDGDDARLKKIFSPVIEDELINQRAEKILTPVIEDIEKDYTVQAKPRPINLFYLKDDMRSRIEKSSDNKWHVLNTEMSFSESELKNEISTHPERFSPNVLLRGLYQEMILPNLAFVGGGAEVSYWLELKPLFDYYKINYPAIILRSSCVVIDKMPAAKIAKLGFSYAEIFQPADSLIKKYILKMGSAELKLNGLRQSIEKIFSELKEKAAAIDPTLEANVMAEKAKTDKGLENIEEKMLRSEKRRQEEIVGKIRMLKEKLFPDNVLQERIENFLPFYVKYGEAFIDNLVEHFNPMQKSFMILSEE